MPRPGNDQSVMADSSIARATRASSVPLRPAAYRAATKLPALVPTTKSGRMPASSSTWITPMWAKPRAAPPPSAKPMRGGLGSFGGAAGAGLGVDAVTGGAWGGLWQALRPAKVSQPSS